MKNPVRLLRASYWTGAIVDGKAALLLLLPGVFPRLNEVIFGSAGEPSPAAVSLQRAYAILILSWTCLLVWADRRPLERKGVLVLTVFPLLSGLIVLRVYNTVTGFHDRHHLPFTVVLGLLWVFFGYSWWVNRGGDGELARAADSTASQAPPLRS